MIFIRITMMRFSTVGGILSIFATFSAVYIAIKKNNKLYLFMMIIPIVPIIYFFYDLEVKRKWIFILLFILAMMAYNFTLGPRIPARNIDQISLNVNDYTYTASKEDNPELINEIKWILFKEEYKRNIERTFNREIFKIEEERGDIEYIVKRPVGRSIYVHSNIKVDQIIDLFEKHNICPQ